MLPTDVPEAPARTLLITGATGFVGSALVRRLLERGWPAERLRCLVRDVARATALGLPPAGLCRGDLDRDDGPALRTALASVDVVVHLAGALKGHDQAGFDRVNVHGTRSLLAAAAAGGCPHVVQVSSLAAAGPSLDGRGSAAVPAECQPVSHYGRSKLGGELAVVASGLPYTILRPPVVYGPGDAATRLLFRQALGLVTAVPPTPRPLSVIHVDDVVDAVERAIDQLPAAAVLPLDGKERTDTHAFLRAIAAACGHRARLLPVPLAVAGAAAAACDLWARLTGRDGFFNRDKVREIRAPGWVADGSAAHERLGFVPRVALAAGLAAVARAEGFAPVTSATA